MPPKVRFTKEEIIDAGLSIAKTEGIDNVTIRKIADVLGSSIAPIYVNFETVEDLKRAIMHRVFDSSQEMLLNRYSDKPFLNIGIASLKFAKENPVLFRDLMMKQNEYIKDYEPKLQNIAEIMKEDPDLEGLTDEEQGMILFKMRVFTLGLSVMEANRLLPESFTEEHLIQILESTGDDIALATKIKKENFRK